MLTRRNECEIPYPLASEKNSSKGRLRLRIKNALIWKKYPFSFVTNKKETKIYIK
jgi:hypothetical protein